MLGSNHQVLKDTKASLSLRKGILGFLAHGLCHVDITFIFNRDASFTGNTVQMVFVVSGDRICQSLDSIYSLTYISSIFLMSACCRSQCHVVESPSVACRPCQMWLPHAWNVHVLFSPITDKNCNCQQFQIF